MGNCNILSMTQMDMDVALTLKRSINYHRRWLRAHTAGWEQLLMTTFSVRPKQTEWMDCCQEGLLGSSTTTLRNTWIHTEHTVLSGPSGLLSVWQAGLLSVCQPPIRSVRVFVCPTWSLVPSVRLHSIVMSVCVLSFCLPSIFLSVCSVFLSVFLCYIFFCLCSICLSACVLRR